MGKLDDSAAPTAKVGIKIKKRKKYLEISTF
jgi:hypothetical protein